MSILWRASITKRPFFSEVNLGPHEEIIRKMIINDKPGDLADYPTIMYFFISDISGGVVVRPKRCRTELGHNVYFFHIGRLMVTYYINSSTDPLPQRIIENTIKPAGDFTIFNIPKGQGIEMLKIELGMT